MFTLPKDRKRLSHAVSSNLFCRKSKPSVNLKGISDKLELGIDLSLLLDDLVRRHTSRVHDGMRQEFEKERSDGKQKALRQ